ncbi:superoxide dismutase family protein [Thiohalorhabdus methylotrophus]|uniref:Superoxide dismutase [Cu-Zn] n=1 Tax=Thiohalorhabdus methylotrophus TaxID=3242694 RepID=A0ABV4TU41_9GAMM
MARAVPGLSAAVLLLCGLVAAGQALAEEATAQLENKDGEEVGEVTLEESPHGVLVHAELDGMPEGTHAFHIHEKGKCKPPFKSAGGHYNPKDHQHGFMNEDGYHAGDMPNIYVPDSGELEAVIFNPKVSMNDELLDDNGAAVVIHEGADDYMTDPAGDAGPRIACGVIEQ